MPGRAPAGLRVRVGPAALCVALATCGGDRAPGSSAAEADAPAAVGRDSGVEVGRDSGVEAGQDSTAAVVGSTGAGASAAHDRDARVEIVDAAGRAWTFERPARRVVSLVPSATASLRAMGAEEVLVGRTDFDTQAWARPLRSVGGGIEPNLEVLAALEPDLVVRFAGAQDPRTPERLDALGIPHVAVRPDRIEDIYATNTLLGEATGRGARADSLNRAIREGLDAVAAAAERRPRVRSAFVLGGSPPWVAGPGTYVHQVIELAGGTNVFDDLDRLYAPVSPEELRTRRIDVVLVSERGSFDASLTPGARIAEVGDALEMPGPDVVEAARRVSALLHGRVPPGRHEDLAR